MKKHYCLRDPSKANCTKNVFRNVSRVLKKMQPAMYWGNEV